MKAPFHNAFLTLRAIELSAPEGLVYYVGTYKGQHGEGFTLKVARTELTIIITSNDADVINIFVQNKQMESFPPIQDANHAASLILTCIKYCQRVYQYPEVGSYK